MGDDRSMYVDRETFERVRAAAHRAAADSELQHFDRLDERLATLDFFEPDILGRMVAGRQLEKWDELSRQQRMKELNELLERVCKAEKILRPGPESQNLRVVATRDVVETVQYVLVWAVRNKKGLLKRMLADAPPGEDSIDASDSPISVARDQALTDLKDLIKSARRYQHVLRQVKAGDPRNPDDLHYWDAAKRQLKAIRGGITELSNGRAPYNVEKDAAVLTHSFENATKSVRALFCAYRFEVLNLWNEELHHYVGTNKRAANRIRDNGGEFDRIFVIDPDFKMDALPIGASVKEEEDRLFGELVKDHLDECERVFDHQIEANIRVYVYFHHDDTRSFKHDMVLIDDQRLHVYDRVEKRATGYWWSDAYVTLHPDDVNTFREFFDQLKSQSSPWYRRDEGHEKERKEILGKLRLYLLRSKRIRYV